jgi:hypothetical protein
MHGKWCCTISSMSTIRGRDAAGRPIIAFAQAFSEHYDNGAQLFQLQTESALSSLPPANHSWHDMGVVSRENLGISSSLS